MKKIANNIKKIKDCISEAHKFSQNLGESKHLKFEYLITNLKDMSPTDIHIALIELDNKKEISYDSDNGFIILI
jgi:hypothetical protein